MTDEDGNPIGARVGQNTNQGNNRSEVSVYAWVIGFFVACFVGWYFFIKSDDEEKCGTGFILENGKCRAVKMADPVTVPPGSVPLITPTGIVAVPAGPVNVPVVIADPVNMPSYRKDIEAMRGFAIIIVLIYHLDDTFMPHGYLGVDIFFVLSGYLTSKSLLRRGDLLFSDIMGYWQRRIWRLIPGLLFVAVVLW